MKKKFAAMAMVLCVSMAAGCGSDAAQTQTVENVQETVAETDAAGAQETETEGTSGETSMGKVAGETEAADGIADGEIPDDIPNTFVEEAAGKTEFGSYEELISYLKKGEGYAYVKLTGQEEDALVISDSLFEDSENNLVSDEADIYLISDGKVRYGSVVGGRGKDYPVRAADGLIYEAGEDFVGSSFISEETHGVMYKDYVMKVTEDDGSVSYIGTLRESNDFDHDEDVDTDSDEIYEKEMGEYDAASVVVFTEAE